MIRNIQPKGITYSWNLGYRIAESLGYSSVVMSNNDVLIGHSALEILVDGLARSALTVPLTTIHGAGHNPEQVIVYYSSLRPLKFTFGPTIIRV